MTEIIEAQEVQVEEIVMNEIVVPAELKQIVIQQSKSKQQEVIAVLNTIFNSASDWEGKIEGITIRDEFDKMAMTMAGTARKTIKEARLNAEKLFDAKRLAVQTRMSDDKLEDTLWLKSRQIMVATLKNLEEKAAEKENFAKNLEAERKRILGEERARETAEFLDGEIIEVDLANMPDSVYDIFLKGLKDKKEADRVAAEAEATRIELERIEREAQEEKERNERLAKEEADRKERLAKEEADREERQKREEEQRLIREKEHQDRLAKEAQDRAEAAERQRIADAEAKAKHDKFLKDREETLAREKAEFEAQKARNPGPATYTPKVYSDYESWINSFKMPNFDGNDERKAIVEMKFNGFKAWALKLVEVK